MADVPRVLFVLFEGLADTVIDSQVLDHARDMAIAGVANFEIWAFACDDALHARSLEKRDAAAERAGAPVRVLRGVRPLMPGGEAINAHRLDAALARYRPAFDILHARTDYTAAVCARLRDRDRFTLVWDCRGDAVAEMQARAAAAPPPYRPLFALRARALAGTRRRAARGCDRAAFVSRPLHDLAQPLIGDKPAIVTHCAASERHFGFDPDRRRRMRATLGYAEGQTVHVYSGSLAPYQCFDETVALFRSVRDADPAARLLVLCPDAAGARQRIAGLDPADVTVIAASHAAVNGYLNAADIAIMLRQPSPLNHVSSPTKFAEYCLAGLPVVMTEAVHDAAAQARRLGNLVAADLAAGTCATPQVTDRAALAAAARKRLGKASLVPLYRALYIGTETNAG
mgnify:CR=1 FL=1